MMNNKLFILACMLSLSSCAWLGYGYDEDECFGPDCDNAYYAENTAYNNAAVPEICQTSGDPSLCARDPFVNYTRTPADFRRYGERTPRDWRISQSGAGNNISASVPPSIEDEVVAYETQVVGLDDISDTLVLPGAPAPVNEPAPVMTAEPAKTPAAPAVVAENTVTAPAATAPAAAPTAAPTAAPATAPAAATPAVVEETIKITEQPCVENGVDYVENCVVIEDEEVVSEEPIDQGDEDPVRDWVAEEGQTLKGLLTEWSDQSGWRLIWNTNRNYVLSAGAMFRGRFADVSSALVRAFARARPAPIATFYNGNRVLVVETMEDENAYE